MRLIECDSCGFQLILRHEDVDNWIIDETEGLDFCSEQCAGDWYGGVGASE